MSRTCIVCLNPQRVEIDKALVNGETFRIVSRRFGTSVSGLFRHKGHLTETLLIATQAERIANADSLIEEIVSLRERARSLTRKAEAEGDYRTALAGIKEQRGCVETGAKLLELQRKRRWEQENFIPVQQAIDYVSEVGAIAQRYMDKRSFSAFGLDVGHHFGRDVIEQMEQVAEQSLVTEGEQIEQAQIAGPQQPIIPEEA